MSSNGRPSPPSADVKRGYGRGARVLSIGIAATGLFTFAYFALASHLLTRLDYKRVSLLWSVMFVIVSIIYRPIEQLLSRTIAERRARGLHREHPLRVPLTIQGSFAAVFLVAALLLRDRIQNHVFDHSAALYWVLVVGVLAYAASYFARGWLAGHERFGLYGGLALLESLSRFLFALGVAVGIGSGQSAVALGIAAAPLVSLVIVPLAFSHGSRALARRRVTDAQPARSQGAHFDAAAADAALQGPAAEALEEASGDLSLRRSGGFAAAVFAIMLSEQTLLNAAVITVAASADETALAGFAFNVLLIARAPLQLFQSIQTSLLPHLAGLEVTAGVEGFARAVRITVAAIAVFAGLLAVALLAIGPSAMRIIFGGGFRYARGGLALVGLGMGLHLVAATLNQAALARRQVGYAAAAWLLAAGAFVGWLTVPIISDQLQRVEVGYFGATGLLSLLLFALYRRGVPGRAG